jgi:hypothetical protein
MNREFVSTEIFDRLWNKLGLTDKDLINLQIVLLDNPKVGSVIPNSGGARKLRIEAKGKGKSGGARVIYVDFVLSERIYLLAVYAKGEKTNLTQNELKKFSKIIKQLGKDL